MTLREIFWPWGVIARMRGELAKAEETFLAVNDAYRETRLRLMNAETEIARLRSELSGAHRRDPKTGRILPVTKKD